MSPANGWKNSREAKDVPYPSKLASHDEVAKDPAVFWDTLRRFHFLMNTKFMIPVIGGKELDLHTLYVEVTGRGGFEKVVAEKKWREVGTIFMFSPTTTSASFVLRKHYSTLLFHYEQVYFFNAQGPLRTPLVTSPPSGRSGKPEWAIVPHSSKASTDFPTSHFDGVGTIDGKFDCGYLVTVKFGSEILSGVLYHPEEEAPTTSIAQCGTAIVPYAGKPRVSRRRRRSRRRGDPNYPKPNRSGYNFFFAEKHYKLKSLYPNREREFTKMIGESWTKLSAEERTVYQNIGLKDKERYRRELKEYKERVTIGPATEVGRGFSEHNKKQKL